MIEKAKQLMCELMQNENSGHGVDHVMRVFGLSMKFAESESCNKIVVGLASLLHDVDDYKIFGQENAENLTNAKNILNKINAPEEVTNQVLTIIKTMGYSKSLKGIRPQSIEGKLVSDADMCEAIGANGIIRTCIYSTKHNRPFFDRDAWPLNEVTVKIYIRSSSGSAVCHFFEKGLKIHLLVMTEAGKKEATARHNILVDFLRQLFREENAPDWEKFLDEYLMRQDNK